MSTHNAVTAFVPGFSRRCLTVAMKCMLSPGEEFGYVLEGILRLWIEEERYDLLPGDSIHFMATVKHRLENPGTEAVTALWVLTPPVF